MEGAAGLPYDFGGLNFGLKNCPKGDDVCTHSTLVRVSSQGLLVCSGLSSELSKHPKQIRLWGTAIVLFRDSKGVPHILIDAASNVSSI